MLASGEVRLGDLLLLISSGGGGFDPRSVAGLQFWVAASQITDLNDGDPVTTWQDRSGNARDLTQSTAAKKPTYQENEKNGRAIVRNDTTDDGMQNPAFQTFPAKRGSVFVVVKATETGAVQHLIGNYFEATGTLWQWQLNNSSTAFYDGSTSQTLESGLSSAYYLLEIIRTGDTTLQYYRGGVLKTTLTIADNQPTSQTLKVGSNINGAGLEALSADYAEILVYDSALSAGDRILVENYLNQKWGL